MVEKDDIAALLQTGSWRTSRSRSRDPHDSQGRAYDTPRPNIGVPRTAEPGLRKRRPPPPKVEDEEESLAHEHVGSVVSAASDGEPKNRGDIDQHPILLPVHEYNAERRFVIVPGAADGTGPNTDDGRYDANTCRKFVVVDSDNGTGSTANSKEEKTKPDLSKRRSHQDLPRLNTEFEETASPIRRTSSRQGREEVVINQEPRGHNTSRERTRGRTPDDDFLSPTVRQTAGRREKVYWDSRSETGRGSARSPSSRRDARVEVSNGRRQYHSASNDPSRSSRHRRASSATSVPNYGPIPRDMSRSHEAGGRTKTSADVQDAYVRKQEYIQKPAPFVVTPGETQRPGPSDEFSGSAGPAPKRPESLFFPDKMGNPDDVLAFMAPGDDFMTGRRGRDVSSSRSRHSNSPPPHPRGAREMPAPSPTRRREHRPGTRRHDGDSSDDNYRERRSGRAERPYPRRSTLEREYTPLPPPGQVRQPNPKPGTVIPALVAGQAAQLLDNVPLPGARSATFPADRNRKVGDRSVSPSPPTSASPSRRPARGSRHSRDAGSGSVSNLYGSLPPSIPGSLGRNNNAMGRSAATAPVASLREESPDPRSPVLYWQPDRSDEMPDTDNDVQNSALARLPDCRWKHPTVARNRTGSDRFLTLKRAETFMICPDCYSAVFANTQFQHLFVAAPVRSGGQLISCDFGSSPWYRIAYLMTLKQQYPDLRLLQGIESVAARSQACAGGQLATRIWYSVMGPNSRHPIQSFNVCLGCAKMVEVLLPNLAGVFVPLDSHEPARGICELHFTPERKRFFTYFGDMEATSDRALSRRTAPNIAELADRIRSTSLQEECLRNTPVPNRKWHVLQRMPDFTVCEECFDAVVWPMVEGEDASEIPRNFYKLRQLRPVAACQLYSDRMRKVFREACEYNDFDFLASCALERRSILAAVKARFNELQREDQEAPAVQEELGALAKRFKEVE